MQDFVDLGQVFQDIMNNEIEASNFIAAGNDLFSGKSNISRGHHWLIRALFCIVVTFGDVGQKTLWLQVYWYNQTCRLVINVLNDSDNNEVPYQS